MVKKSVKLREVLDTLIIFRRSLIFQTKEFFQNSTLHGVRYIAETGRPVGEKYESGQINLYEELIKYVIF